jgi:hypothetical protein
VTANKTFGQYRQRLDDRHEYLTLAFSPLSAPLRSRWRNNGLSADFLGDYVTTFLPTGGIVPGDEGRQAEIRHAVTYIANELLENAMKYHDRDVDIPIGIHLELADDHVTVSASNGVGAGQVQRYRQFVEQIVGGNAADLLIRQLEEGADGEPTRSGLGLLTMITDYGAELGWLFEADPTNAEVMTVTTKAILPFKALSGVVA